MTIERKTVKNTQYLYFLQYDPETKGKKETYCGPVTDIKARAKARKLESEYLMRQLSTIQQQLQEIREQGLSEYERPVCRPFVKWAGGKSQLLGRLEKYIPRTFNSYYEPFLGSGSVFFYLVNTHVKFPAKLSDNNKDLVNAYEVIRDNVDKLIRVLTNRQGEFSKLSKLGKAAYYSRVRSEAPGFEDKIARANWFIFLNKTCYNGLYRVNQSGGFNVPYGDNKNVRIFESRNLRAISKLLNRSDVKISREDYAAALSNAGRGDFCYLDPPYFPAVVNGFTSYTPESFTKDDHEKLATLVDDLTQRGCMVLLSNSSVNKVRELYEGYHFKEVDALRAINSDKNGRKGTKELLIRNYELIR